MSLAALCVVAIVGLMIGSLTGPPADARDEGSFLPPDPKKDAVAEPFQIYLSATGQDANAGLSPAEPVLTLARAQEILQAAAPRTDVEVRIEQGVYVAPQTTWTFVVPGRTVTFLPIDYEYGKEAGDIAGRPVFRGDGTSGFWLSAELPEGNTGGTIGLRFYYLQVDRYDLGGVKIDGGIATVDGVRRPATSGHNGNAIVGMYFTRLGSRWADGTHGFGGVDLINSSHNRILDNHFVRLENDGTRADLIHGVYLAHHSMANSIRGNRFEIVSGDPIRARNDSSDNEVFHNVFQRSGSAAIYSDWFCDRDCAEANRRGHECASHGNVFRENDIGSGYSGGAIPNWHLTRGDLHYAGGEGCSNDGQPRVRTYGNE